VATVTAVFGVGVGGTAVAEGGAPTEAVGLAGSLSGVGAPVARSVMSNSRSTESPSASKCRTFARWALPPKTVIELTVPPICGTAFKLTGSPTENGNETLQLGMCYFLLKKFTGKEIAGRRPRWAVVVERRSRDRNGSAPTKRRSA
jgi:hypothetical protein